MGAAEGDAVGLGSAEADGDDVALETGVGEALDTIGPRGVQAVTSIVAANTAAPAKGSLLII